MGMRAKSMRCGAGLMWVAALACVPAGASAEQAAQSHAYRAADASEAATLVADSVQITGQDRLVAEGAVEVFWKDSRVTARRITYDQSADQLLIEGPIRLTQPGNADTIIVADQAQLSPDLQNGVLVGARMVIARELQLAAARIERAEGRTTQMQNVVASSCSVCANDPTPLWEIRARTITHDEATRQLYFRDAQFRFAGVPLMWLPGLRMPDPTVERMSGILRPSLRTTTLLGFGVKVPYFFELGPSADLTLTPYVSTNWTRTLEARYRRAFNSGTIDITGALSNDSIRDGATRGYVFGNGQFDLSGDFRLGFQLQMASDDSYLLNYDVSDADRLWSGITLEKVSRAELLWMRVGNTHSLREGESNETQPMASGDLTWSRIFRPQWIGGQMSIDWGVHMHRRASTLDYDTGADPDDVSDGRDMMRTSFTVGWQRQWLGPVGILGSTQAQVVTDAVAVRQDDQWRSNTLRAQPTLGAEVRWPWVKASGAAEHVIEPVAQVLWSPNHLKNVPNEDSLLTEFDEGNLFSVSRFPGGDARERGFRANLGVNWTRFDSSGWSVGMTVGRVLRASDLDQFHSGSGLRGKQSDWLVSGTVTSPNGLTLTNRALFDDNLEFSRDELRLGFADTNYQIAAGYLWMRENELEGRNDATSELLLESGWRWREGWRSTFRTRYDFTAERAARAAFGIEYTNECLAVDVSLSRRFTSSSSVEPETSLGLSVQLAGFGAGSATGAARSACRR